MQLFVFPATYSSLVPRILDIPGLKASFLIVSSPVFDRLQRGTYRGSGGGGGREIRLLPTCCTTHGISWGKSLGMGLQKSTGLITNMGCGKVKIAWPFLLQQNLHTVASFPGPSTSPAFNHYQFAS